MSDSAIKKITPWVKLVLAVGGMLVSVVVYAFTTFELKSDTQSGNQRIEKHMDRIELKVDALLIRGGIKWQHQKAESSQQ